MSDKIHESEPGAVQAARSASVPRRDFLIQSSAALVGAGVVAAGFDVSAAAAGILTPSNAPPVLSVGFWEGRLEESEVEQTRPLVAGESIRAGDDHFTIAGEAQVTIHGFWRAADSTEPCSLHLLPRHHVKGSSSKINVFAWNYVDHGCGRVSGSPRTVKIPVGDDGVVELAIDHRTLAPASRAATTHPAAGTRASANAQGFSDIGAVLSLSTGSRRSALKLRRGSYVIAVGARPDWRTVAVLDKAGVLSSEAGPLVTGSPAQPAAFDYLVLSIA